MDNVDLKREADLLIQRCRLSELLSTYPAWFVGGSYSYDLMCWRDLDIYALDPQHDLRECFRVGYELTERLRGWKSRFTNNVGNSNGGTVSIGESSWEMFEGARGSLMFGSWTRPTTTNT